MEQKVNGRRLGLEGTPLSVFQSSIYLYAMVGSFAFGVWFAGFRFYEILLKNTVLALVYGACWLLARKGYDRISMIIAVSAMSVQVYQGGILLGWGYGTHYYLLAAIPLLCACSRLNGYLTFLSGLPVLAVYILLRVLLIDVRPRYLLPAPWIDIMNDVNLIVSFGAVSFSLFWYSRSYSTAERRLVAAHGEILQIACTDALTGVANRRYICQVLDQAIKDAPSLPGKLAVAMADLDDFKRLNDRYGHECGDAILVEVCRRFQQTLRKSDSFGRWGGEEFLFVLRIDGPGQVENALDRLRGAISGHPLSWREVDIDLSVTIGVAYYRRGVTLDDLVSEADLRMYEGKRKGKDRVVLTAEASDPN